MRTDDSPLAATLLGTARASVLASLLLHPERQLHVREIARTTGVSPGSLHRELKTLTELGLLQRHEEGRQVYYRADLASPVYGELSGFLRKTLGLGDQLRQALLPLADRLQLAFVYGSMASGSATPSSDVDVMVVGAAPFAEVVKALHPLQQALGREVNPSVMTPEEFRKASREKAGFVPTVLRSPKIWLIGGDDELGEPGKDRAAETTPADRRRTPAAARSGKAQSRGRRAR